MAVLAVRFLRTTPQVFFSAHRLQVVGNNAGRGTAQMVNVEADGYRTHHFCIEPTIRREFVSSGTEAAVALINPPYPNPMAVSAARINVRPEASQHIHAFIIEDSPIG
jgi:hypothetical protein